MNKRVKIIPILISIILCISLICIVPANAAISGTYEKLSYFIDDGKITITKCDKTATGIITIPATIDEYSVNAISSKAFANCNEITEVIIQEGIKSIGEESFYCCNSLTSINVPTSVTHIGFGVFTGCNTLQKMSLPFIYGSEYGINYNYLCYYFGNYDYKNNSNYVPKTLKEITITASKYISKKTFYNCNNIELIILNEGITRIEEGAFQNCSKLKSIIFPNTTVTIDDYAFAGCTSLEDIYVSTNLTYIGKNAFYDCLLLTDIYMCESESDRENISIESSNYYLLNANWHYNCCPSGNSHSYDNKCDTECNECKYIRTITHTYSNPCDATCNVCKNVRTISHKYGEYIYDNNATYENDGTKTRTCSVCNATDTITAEGTKLEKLIDTSVVFKDVSSNKWYKKFIDYAVTKKIFTGTSYDTFSPEENMTRAQFVQVFANISGVDTSNRNVNSGFSDVPKGKWYTAAVTWAAKNGIVNGVGGGRFDPNAKVTREQMCVMIVNYIENYQKKTLNITTNASTFADDAKIAKWAKTAVYKCAKAGLVNGVGNNKFDPKASATRAQGATLFTNFYKQYMK